MRFMWKYLLESIAISEHECLNMYMMTEMMIHSHTGRGLAWRQPLGSIYVGLRYEKGNSPSKLAPLPPPKKKTTNCRW